MYLTVKMESVMDNWIKQGLVIIFGVFTILHPNYTEACSCEFRHPQQQFCDADFVIKATVKRTNALFEDTRDLINEITQDPFRNDTHLVETVNAGPLVKGRIYYVKIKKVFKYTEQYGEIEGRYKDQDIDLMPVYTSPNEGTCGVTLIDKTTYLLQGHVRDSELHISICNNQVEWSQENIPVYMRKAYGKLYEENCHCNILITRHPMDDEAANNECVWDKRQDVDDCYAKHAACMKKDDDDHCKWSKPASLRACLVKTEQRRMAEP